MKSKPITFLCLCISAACIAASGGQLLAQDTSSLTNLLGQLKSGSASSGDTTLESLASQLSSKVTALNTSLAGSPAKQGLLTNAVQSLLATNGGDSLSAFQKLAEAKLTPEQTKLAKDVGHVGSAYLVQKNLGDLDGSQSDVAQIVTSLRKGNYSDALPAIQKVSQNAALTQPQKDLLSSVATQFAPGAGKVGEALKGIKGIPGFGK